MNTDTETPLPMTEIRKAFDALHYAFDSETTNWADKLFDQCRQEEKGHRGFMAGFARCHTSDTASTNDAARMFAVKRIAEYLIDGAKLPEVKDYLHIQKSCFMAAAIAAEYRSKILTSKCWDGLDVFKYAKLDYVHYVKVKKTEPKREYQPKTGAACSCRPGQERDNCPRCESTGQVIDFAKIRARQTA